MKTAVKCAYILCFLAIILIPLFMLNAEKNVASDLDNRMLTEMPDIRDAGFNWKFEAYLQERIGLRTEMITAYTNLHAALFNQLIHPSYMFGRNGHVFVDIHNNVPYDEYHKCFARFVRNMQEYCESRGVRFYFMFEPEKASVYRQYLPAGIQYDDSWVEEMLGYMRELGVTVVDNKALLIEKSKEEQVFNPKWDVYHWNELGCYIGTNNLLSRIHEDIPEVEENTNPTFEEGFAKYLPQSRFEINETIKLYRKYDEQGNEVSFVGRDLTDQYRDGININQGFDFFRYLRNDAEDRGQLPKMLVFEGSYYNEEERDKRFLAGRSSEYIAIHNYQNVLNLDYYFTMFQPDVVVFEVAEYTLTDYFFDSGKMASVNWNPALNLTEQQTAALPATGQGSLAIRTQNGIDTYTVSGELSQQEAQYVYLLLDGEAYDMWINPDTGSHETCIQHDESRDIAEYQLIVVNDQGDMERSDLWIVSKQCVSEQSKISDGVTTDEGRYIFRTELEDNRFDAVELLTMSNEFGVDVQKVAYAEGLYQGFFVHDEPSGNYTIRLVANSNLRDEYIDASAWLDEGEAYYYSFTVDSLKETEAIVSDYEILAEGDQPEG